MHVTSSGVFNNNSKIRLYKNIIIVRVELDESQCKCVTCLFCYLYSRDCLASRAMTVAFRVWLSEMIAVGCF